MRLWGKEGMTWPTILGKCGNGSQSSACYGVFGTSVGYCDAGSRGTWVVVGNGGATREVEATGARLRNTRVLMRKG
jgi:hypothetical protein